MIFVVEALTEARARGPLGRCTPSDSEGIGVSRVLRAFTYPNPSPRGSPFVPLETSLVDSPPGFGQSTFFFFKVHYCASRGTEPHVALVVHDSDV